MPSGAFEMFYARRDDGQISRQRDRNWPLWSMFDVTLDGRPSDWFPAYSYDTDLIDECASVVFTPAMNQAQYTIFARG